MIPFYLVTYLPTYLLTYFPLTFLLTHLPTYLLCEDASTNRMDEAVTLYDQICNHPSFGRTSMILFLNKVSLYLRWPLALTTCLGYSP